MTTPPTPEQRTSTCADKTVHGEINAACMAESEKRQFTDLVIRNVVIIKTLQQVGEKLLWIADEVATLHSVFEETEFHDDVRDKRLTKDLTYILDDLDEVSAHIIKIIESLQSGTISR